MLSKVFPVVTVSGLFYPLSTKSPGPRVWGGFKEPTIFETRKKIYCGSNVGKVNYKIKFKIFTYLLPQ